MSNPLINQQSKPDIKQMFNEFKANPAQMLIKAKFNLPDNIGSDPQAIVQHLLNTGQITQQQVNAAQGRLQWFRQFFA